MRVIVVGAGEVGSYVAELLTRHGNDVAVIETDRQRLRDVGDRLDVLVVEEAALVVNHLVIIKTFDTSLC